VQDRFDFDQARALGSKLAQLIDSSRMDPGSAFHYQHPIDVLRWTGRNRLGRWECLEQSTHRWTGDAALEELLEFGKQGVFDIGELQPQAGALLDEPDPAANQQPKPVSAARPCLQKAAILSMELALIKKTRNEASIQGVGLGLLADGQSATFVEGPGLQPLDLIAVPLQPGDHRLGAPQTRRFAADSNLARRVTERLEPDDELSKTLAGGLDAMHCRSLPAAVLHPLQHDGGHNMLAAPRIDADVKAAAGGSCAAPVIS